MISKFSDHKKKENYFFYYKLYNTLELFLFNAALLVVVWYTNGSQLSSLENTLDSSTLYIEQTALQFFFHASNDFEYYWIILTLIGIILLFCIVFLFKNWSFLWKESLTIKLSTLFLTFLLYCTLLSFLFFFVVSFSSNFLCDPLMRTYDTTLTFHENPLNIKMAPRSVINNIFLPPFYSEIHPNHHNMCVYNSEMSMQSKIEFTIVLISSVVVSFVSSILIYYNPLPMNIPMRFFLNIAIREFSGFLALSSSCFLLYNATNWDWNVFVWILAFLLIIIFKYVSIALFLKSDYNHHEVIPFFLTLVLHSMWIYYKLFQDIENFLEYIINFF